MHAIVICFDRLPYGLLGCYGNTEACTPGFDRLAAQCVTFDNCFAADLRQEGVDAIARPVADLSRHGVLIRPFAYGETALVRSLRAESTELETEQVERTPSATSGVDSIKRAIRTSEEASVRQPVVTLFSLPGLWGDGDAAAGDAVASADGVVGRVVDATADRNEEDRPLMIVTAARGGPFDETSGTSAGDVLREQMIHVPLFVRPTPVPIFGARCGGLVTTADVAATLAECCGRLLEGDEGRSLLAAVRGDLTSGRDAVVVRGPHRAYGLRTAEWHLMTKLTSGEGAGQVAEAAESAVLSMKPDDLWDQFDVAKQSPEVVETLVKRLVEGLARTDSVG